MDYNISKKKQYIDKRVLKYNILTLADEIRNGEEDGMEAYEEAVKVFADITRNQAPASETDPIAYEALVEEWGEDPGETIQYGGKRPMNYLEMIKFRRGYWR